MLAVVTNKERSRQKNDNKKYTVYVLYMRIKKKSSPKEGLHGGKSRQSNTNEYGSSLESWTSLW